MSGARWIALWGALAGCDEGADPSAVPYDASDYTPAVGMALELVPPGGGSSTPLWLRVQDGRWELREGADWAGAVDVAVWPVDAAGDLVVGEEIALPATFSEGDAFANGQVVSVGDHEVWYGLFPDAVTVALDAGVLAGEVVFGPSVGPIAFTVGSARWELAGYDPP